MSFANPGAWAWAALAVVVLTVYLAHLGRQVQPVAAFALWQRALARRPAWFVLRHWLSLATQVAILLLLVAALAQPFWRAVFEARRNLVLVLDVSASMSTPDDRFLQMQAAAKRMAEDLNRGEQMALVTAGSVVRIAQHWTEDRQILQETLDSLQPTDGASRVAEGVHLARALLARRSNPHVVVLTDACFPEAETLAKTEGIQFHRLGRIADNVGITRWGTRPHPVQQDTWEVLVESANFGTTPALRTLECGLAGGTRETAKLELPAGASQATFFRLKADRAGILSAQLKEQDSLACDNTVNAWVPRRQAPTVIMGTPGTSVLEAAFQANPRIHFQASAGGDAAAPPAKAGASPVVTVLYREIPAQLPAGPVLAIEPQGACDFWTVEGLLRDAAAAVKEVRLDAPQLEGVEFADCVVEQAVRLKFTTATETLVTAASGDPLYTAFERGEIRVLVLHVNLDKSDLGRRTDFERLLDNAVQWLSRQDGTAPASSLTDELVNLPAATAPRQLTAPDGAVTAVAAQQQLTVLDRVGVWQVAGPAPADESKTNLGGESVLASNLANSRESDLRPVAGIASAEEQDTLFVPSGAVPEQPLWMLLVSVAIGALVVEWCLYHRRVVV